MELAFFAQLELQNLGGASAGKLALENNPELNTSAPEHFTLHQNYPNPFNPTTTLKYRLARNAFISLTIYNLKGQRIRTLFQGQQKAGTHSLRWDGTDDSGGAVASGIYLYRIQAPDFERVRKMTLLR